VNILLAATCRGMVHLSSRAGGHLSEKHLTGESFSTCLRRTVFFPTDIVLFRPVRFAASRSRAPGLFDDAVPIWDRFRK
jgi:hypothetical protein